MSSVKVYRIEERTTALGPGVRAAIWFQGCKRCCKGCMSPNSRNFDAGRVWDTDALIKWLCDIADIEGITISGGEPFLQIEALHEIISFAKKKKNLGVIIYTGYTMIELKNLKDPLVDDILSSLADIIIDGEYVEELNDGGALKGSSNQNVNFITKRYIGYRELYESNSRNIQIKINGGTALLIGIPEKSTLAVWKNLTEPLKPVQ